MVQTITILEDGNLLHLQKGDVIVIDPDAHDPVVLYRPLPTNYAAILPTLLEKGMARSNLSVEGLASLAALCVPGRSAPRSERRGVRRLKLLKEA